jgi:sRNA-binding protein
MGKKKKKITLEQRTQALALLRERYPQAFRPAGDVKAFEIGIGTKLTAELKGRLPEGMTSRAIRAALSCYCSQPEYKEARDIGNPRINLAGEVVSQVTSEDKKLGKQFSAEQRRIRKLETAVERAAKRREREEAARKVAEKKREAAKAAKKKKEEERKTSVTGGKGRRNAPKPLGGSPRGAVKTVSSTSQPTIIVKKRRTIK